MGLELKKALRGAAVLMIGPGCLLAHGQGFASQSRAVAKGDAVLYLFPEQVTVPAGKASPVTLHFRIAQGLHINSHTPRQEELIPTDFSIPAGTGVRLVGTSYPAGSDITLPADPKTKLNVYTGEFSIETQIVAMAGNHLIQAKLRYQACSQTECLPPRTIPVAIDVIGK